jgi:hypothetical protein
VTSISSVTSNTNNGGSATISVTTSESPATTQVGDLVIVVHGNNFYALSNMPTPTATGSPTLLNIVDADGGTNFGHLRCWWYVANTSGAQTVSVTETGAHDEEKSMAVYVLSGADTSSPVDGTASNFDSGTGSAPVCSSISPATATALAFNAINNGGPTAPTSYTPPGAVTEQYDVGVGGLRAAGGTDQLSASGPTGAFNWTTVGPDRPWASVTFAIKSATGAASVVGTKSTNRHPGKGPGQARFFQTPRPTSAANIVNIDGSLTVTANRTAAVAVTHTIAGSLTVTANRTAAVAVTHTIGGSRPTTVNRTATVAVTHTISGSRPITVGLAAAVAVTHTISGSRPVTVNRTATEAITHTIAGSRPITVGLAATADVPGVVNISGSLVVTANRTAAVAIIHTVSGSLVVVVTRSASVDTSQRHYLFLPFFG